MRSFRLFEPWHCLSHLCLDKNDGGTRLKRAWNDGFLWGKSSHFCPPALLVPTSFGGHSKISFSSGTTLNDPRTRNAVRMTGTKNRTALDFGSFDHRSPSFGPPSLNSEGRSGYVSVIPTAFLSFRRTRTSCRSVSFLNETTWQRENFSFLGRSILNIFTGLVLGNDTRMTMEWPWNDGGMTSKWHWNDNGMTMEWHWNDIGMSLEQRFQVITGWLLYDARPIRSPSIFTAHYTTLVESIFIQDGWTAVRHTFHKATGHLVIPFIRPPFSCPQTLPFWLITHSLTEPLLI